jgi:hypothetical protein
MWHAPCGQRLDQRAFAGAGPACDDVKAFCHKAVFPELSHCGQCPPAAAAKLGFADINP